MLSLVFTGCASVQSAGPQVALRPVSEFPKNLGEPTTLLVFATVWCEPCKKEWPQVVKWAAVGERRVLYVVSGSSKARVQEFMVGRSIAANLQIFVDTRGEIARKFEVQATPTLYLYKAGDRKGPVHRLGGLVGR